MCCIIYYAIYSYLSNSTNISQINSGLFLWLILIWGIGYFVETVSGCISNVTTLKLFLARLNPSKLQYSSYSAYCQSVNQITAKANGLWHKRRTTCYKKKQKTCNQTAEHFRRWETELSRICQKPIMKTAAVNHMALVPFRSLPKYTKKHKGTIQNSLSPGPCLLPILKSCYAQLNFIFQSKDGCHLFIWLCVYCFRFT